MKTAESNFFFDAAVFFMRNYIGKKYAVEKVEKNIRRYFQYSLFSRVFETKITGKVRL